MTFEQVQSRLAARLLAAKVAEKETSNPHRKDVVIAEVDTLTRVLDELDEVTLPSAQRPEVSGRTRCGTKQSDLRGYKPPQRDPKVILAAEEMFAALKAVRAAWDAGINLPNCPGSEPRDEAGRKVRAVLAKIEVSP